jgi:hypothetical protein
VLSSDHFEKPGRILSHDKFCAIIDDVVPENLTAEQIASAHGGKDLVRTTLGHVTTATQGGGRVKPISEGGWYAFRGNAQCYEVAPGFAAAWKQKRGQKGSLGRVDGISAMRF